MSEMRDDTMQVHGMCVQTTHNFAVILSVSLKSDAIRDYVAKQSHHAHFSRINVMRGKGNRYVITCMSLDHIDQIKEIIAELETKVLEAQHIHALLDMVVKADAE